ncbi:MAG TPA: metal-dependent phosphohydrolase [Xanthobacteraceae bacterium]|nr:metal-dependent phosphohydrolase [Xanthobacteraceae bacterium]
MIARTELSAEALGNFLATEMSRRCGSSHPRLTELVPFAAQLALECIANSDALYHNVEHTMLVTLAGHDIFVGRALMIPSTPNDYAHLIIACLMHDIGYVRGILRGDSVDGYVIDTTGRKASLPRGSSDAALMPYHVDRSKMFVHDRMRELDAERIAHAIEFTRFPATPVASRNEANEEGLLVRAADLIGQLGDPHYLRKSNALFCEFEEVGMNKQLGYESPADIVDKYPQFYWNMVSPHIQAAIRYLNVTASGRQWIANLYSNVFRAEREVRLSGPQP